MSLRYGREKLLVLCVAVTNVHTVREQIPEFTRKRYAASVYEGTASFTYNEIKATYVGDGLSVTYSIMPGPDQNYFTIDAASGSLKLVSMVDFEVTHQLTVTIKATVNKSSDTKYAVTQFVLDINDIDDTNPVFHRNVYNIYIDYAISKGTILQNLAPSPPILAFDQDRDINEPLEYAVMALMNWTSITPSSGHLHTLTLLHPAKTYLAIIKATQVNNDTQTRRALLRVHANETRKSPTVPTFNITIDVAENRPPGSVLLDVRANINVNNTFFNAFCVENCGRHFVISDSGFLMLMMRLDFEEVSQHVLTIKVFDVHRNYSLSVITVRIYNVNEFAPVTETHETNVFVKRKPNKFITRIQASDRDGERVVYNFSAPNQYFRIDATGKLYTTGKINDLSTIVSVYHLTVLMSDTNAIPRSSYHVVHISLPSVMPAEYIVLISAILVVFVSLLAVWIRRVMQMRRHLPWARPSDILSIDVPVNPVRKTRSSLLSRWRASHTQGFTQPMQPRAIGPKRSIISQPAIDFARHTLGSITEKKSRAHPPPSVGRASMAATAAPSSASAVVADKRTETCTDTRASLKSVKKKHRGQMKKTQRNSHIQNQNDKTLGVNQCLSLTK